MRTLCVIIMALVCVSFSYAAESLLVYLPFDEEGAVARDASGNGNDGQILSEEGGAVKLVAGKHNGAIELDGKSYVDIPWSDAIDVADGSFSVEIWFNYTEASEKGVLAWGYDMGSGPHAQFWFRTEPADNRIRCLINDGTGAPSAIVATPAPYNDGNWHHMAVVRDAENKVLSAYIDGEMVGTTEAEVGSLTTTHTIGIQIGQRGVDGINKFIGSLDEFRLWKKALTSNEIEENMTKDVSSAVRPADHLATTWAEIKVR